jgi:hypothetical protein
VAARAKIGAMSTPDWSEDPDLAAALTEVEEFVADAGWDRPPQLFALVRTEELAEAEPSLAAGLGGSEFTPIAQDALPDADLERALAQVSWPPAVSGCVLVQEIVVLPPSAGEALSQDPTTAAAQASTHPDRTEARLVAGVLRDGRRACLLRVRADLPDGGQIPLVRGAQLAPNLLDSLALTLE